MQLAIDAGEFAPDTDATQVAFEFVGLVLIFYRSESVLGTDEAHQRARKAFDRLLAQNRP